MELRSNTATSPKGQRRLISIITTAKAVLALEGYENFTLRKIAQKSAISLAAIQHYFASKESLLDAVIDHELDIYEHHWQAISAQFRSDPKGRIERFLSLILDLHLEKETSGFILQFWALSATHPRLHSKMQAFYADFLNKLDHSQQQLNPAQADNEIHERSLLIASIIEGTLVFIAGDRRLSPDARNTRANALALAMSLIQH